MDDSIDGIAVVAIALQPTLGLLGAVLPGTPHGPVLIHQTEQVGADAPEQGSLFHAFKLASAPQACNQTGRNQFAAINVAKHNRGGLGPMQCYRPMTTTQHSNQLLEELVAEEIGFQIDQIAEDLQREGWPIAMVKRFMHVAVERLPE